MAAVEEDGGTVAVGDEIALAGQRFLVEGIMEGGTGGFGRRGDGTVLMPLGAALGVVTNSETITSVGVNLADSTYYEIAGQHLLAGLNTARYAAADSDDYFSVMSAQDAIDAATETTAMLSLFLGIVGSIALFVGGIGTMNMMLTTVTERTKEIGLRKAIGARRSDILGQILAESVMLTCIGGAIGILITYGLSFAVNGLLGEDSVIQVVVSGTVVLYAVLVSFSVGIAFGLYPARRASALQPVDALRAE